jgi:hypothetical protein
MTGTASGHCPRCGFVPPAVLQVPEPARVGWPLPVGLAVLAIVLVALVRLV